ncbi:MAG: hypothetical protein ORN98_05975 [Alphaproteobacteria bacterium]|nr:hypothetical protein [Alphaproteobacteria bacterium]
MEKKHNQEYKPGEIAPESGDYKCSGCGHEVHVEAEGRFPPENHHQHSPEHGAIRWHSVSHSKSHEKSQTESHRKSA